MAAKRRLRVAVVGGCGDWGRRYTYAYARHPEAELMALVDTARERRRVFAERYGIARQFDTVQECWRGRCRTWSPTSCRWARRATR